MRNKIIRLLALFMVITVSFVLFVSCGNDDVSDTSDTPAGNDQSATDSTDEDISYALSDKTLKLVEGATYQLTITPAPKTAIVWQSSNETVATVGYGEITALNAGNAVITAIVGDNTLTCELSVVKEEVLSALITFPKTSSQFVVGSSETLTASLYLNGKISKEKVAWTVTGDADYVVDGNSITLDYKSIGEITVKAKYALAESVYTVYVVPAQKEILSTPELKVEGETVVWKAVDNAVGYSVKIGNNPAEYVEETSYSNGDLLREMIGYTANVKAVANRYGNYEDGEWATIGVDNLWLKITETSDTLRFTGYEGATGYKLYVNGEDKGAVNANQRIDLKPYMSGKGELYIKANTPAGEQKSRTVEFVNDQDAYLKSKVYGNGYAQSTGINSDAENTFTGSGYSLKLCAGMSIDSSFQATYVIPDFDVKKGDVIVFNIKVTDITSNVYSKRSAWDDGAESETVLPAKYLPNLYGFTGTNQNFVKSNGNIEEKTWYEVYATATKDSGELFDFNAWLGPYKKDTEKSYSYTAYVDGLRVIKAIDTSLLTTVKAGYANPYVEEVDASSIGGTEKAFKFDVVTNMGNGYATVTPDSAGWGDFQRRLTNFAWSIKKGDIISYDVYIADDLMVRGYTVNGSSQTVPSGSWTSTSQMSSYSIPVPYSQNKTGKNAPVSLGRWVNTGTWYHVTFAADADYGNEIPFIASRYDTQKNQPDKKIYKYTAYIDNITVTSNSDTDALAKMTITVSDTGRVTYGDYVSINTDSAYTKSGTGVSLKFDVVTHQFNERNILDTTTNGGDNFYTAFGIKGTDFTIGSSYTISYDLYITDLQTAPVSSNKLNGEWTDASTIEKKSLLHPCSNYAGRDFSTLPEYSSYNATYSTGEWIHMEITVTAQSDKESSEKGTFRWQAIKNSSAVAYRYTAYVDNLTITPVE